MKYISPFCKKNKTGTLNTNDDAKLIVIAFVNYLHIFDLIWNDLSLIKMHIDYYKCDDHLHNVSSCTELMYEQNLWCKRDASNKMGSIWSSGNSKFWHFTETSFESFIVQLTHYSFSSFPFLWAIYEFAATKNEKIRYFLWHIHFSQWFVKRT